MKKKAAAKGGPVKKKDEASAVAETDDVEAPADEPPSPKKQPATLDKPSSHARKPSASQQSRLRSTSFRASGPGSSTSPPLKSPTAIAVGSAGPPLSPSEEAADIYRKQASRIEELEKQVKQLESQAAKLPALEEEVEELRESSSDVNASLASLKEKARAADALTAEVASLKRQNTQLQSQVQKRSGRRESGTGGNGGHDDDGLGSSALRAELESKTAAIDALELEISALNARASSASKSADEHASRATDLEAKLGKAEESAELATKELEDLRANLARQHEEAELNEKKEQQPDTAALSRRLAQLEAELASAQRAANLANARADKLDQKVATLTTLHRETESRRAQTQADASKFERELKELRIRIGDLRTDNDRLRDEATRRKKLEAEGDSAGLEELEEEERQRLATRVRELEAEVFELRRGVWRDRRKELQPGLNVPDEEILSTSVGSFDEVDLSASYNGSRRQTGFEGSAAHQRQTSTFADVISSGLRAFTNDAVVSPTRPAKVRKQSLGQLLDEFDDEEDFNFDEEGFRKAQEEEAAARIERVREIKRGLKKWEGWRMDLADMRAGMGGVFDV
jgi:predicted  nucleic acid-binding Zn-ribbon protein